MTPSERHIGGHALAWLVLIAVAESVGVWGYAPLGVALYAGILLGTLVQAGLTRDDRHRAFFFCLSIVPIIRIVSVTIPLGHLPIEWWYLIISVLLLATAAMLIRSAGLAPRQVGLTLPAWRQVPLTIAVALSGILVALVVERLFGISPVPGQGSTQFGIAAASLTTTAGLEELLFRGLIQTAAIGILGTWSGLGYAAAIFGILQMGYGSLPAVLLALVIGTCFGAVVVRTHSLLGVVIAHTTMNTALLAFASSGAVVQPADVARPLVWLATIVTPATIDTVVSGGFASGFGLVAVLALLALLIVKEILDGMPEPVRARWAPLPNAALIPLSILFIVNATLLVIRVTAAE